MPWLPGFGWLVANWYVRPKYERLAHRHMIQFKIDVEERPGG